ncbi:hypothetical protein NE848_09075 [Gramella jeungdoensis]|uniref:Restriction system protein Mrr-like N-terminal domain-containing protein n=1 Tax=Gramella jeungdoensis TaxID=708091 RepID=A0ABT0Z1D2_9FLAO|nr:hypothetical protein [Gramella jeungdoensis]MCM8569531.1 hypothetical protein [Gramella jeungdoensis]
MKSWGPQELLNYFQNNPIPPKDFGKKEKEILQSLHSYKLIVLNADGTYSITTKGKLALNMGVERFIELEKMEVKLASKAPILKYLGRMLFLVTLILLLIIVYLLAKILANQTIGLFKF